MLVRYADLVLLALALPIFLVAELADARLRGRRRCLARSARDPRRPPSAPRAAALARGDRRRALGIVGAATLGRVWLVTLAVLLVGLLGEREDGLAAAVLCLALVTVHLASPRAHASCSTRRPGEHVSRKAKIWLGVGLYLLITIGLLIVLGNDGKNDEFQPQNEFKLDPWIDIKIGGIDLIDQQGGPLPGARERR